jgi:hypothetical protein
MCHREGIPTLQGKILAIFRQNKGHNSRMENVRKSEVGHCFHVMVPDLLYKIQKTLCLREHKLMSGNQMRDRHTSVKFDVPNILPMRAYIWILFEVARLPVVLTYYSFHWL